MKKIFKNNVDLIKSTRLYMKITVTALVYVLSGYSVFGMSSGGSSSPPIVTNIQYVDPFNIPNNVGPLGAQELKIGDVPIYRFRLVIKTCDKNYAGTNDKVYFEIKSKDSTTGQIYRNKYRLDKGGNDRQAGETNYYNILVENLNNLREIETFTIGKYNSNGWCIGDIRVLINNSTVPIWAYTPDGLWLDDDASKGRSNYLTIPKSWIKGNLRSWAWNKANRGQLPTLRIDIQPTLDNSSEPSNGTLWNGIGLSRGALESMIEWKMGHEMQLFNKKETDKRAYWGGKKGRDWVEATRNPNNPLIINFDVDFKIWKKLTWWPDKTFEADLDFELHISCNAEKNIELDIKNVVPTIDDSGFYNWVLGLFYWSLDEKLEKAKKSMLDVIKKVKPIIFNIPVDNKNLNIQAKCPTVNVSSDGDININWNKVLDYE